MVYKLSPRVAIMCGSASWLQLSHWGWGARFCTLARHVQWQSTFEPLPRLLELMPLTSHALQPLPRCYVLWRSGMHARSLIDPLARRAGMQQSEHRPTCD